MVEAGGHEGPGGVAEQGGGQALTPVGRAHDDLQHEADTGQEGAAEQGAGHLAAAHGLAQMIALGVPVVAGRGARDEIEGEVIAAYFGVQVAAGLAGIGVDDAFGGFRPVDGVQGTGLGAALGRGKPLAFGQHKLAFGGGEAEFTKRCVEVKVGEVDTVFDDTFEAELVQGGHSFAEEAVFDSLAEKGSEDVEEGDFGVRVAVDDKEEPGRCAADVCGQGGYGGMGEGARILCGGAVPVVVFGGGSVEAAEFGGDFADKFVEVTGQTFDGCDGCYWHRHSIRGGDAGKTEGQVNPKAAAPHTHAVGGAVFVRNIVAKFDDDTDKGIEESITSLVTECQRRRYARHAALVAAGVGGAFALRLSWGLWGGIVSGSN